MGALKQKQIKPSKEDIKGYQKSLKDLNLYEGEIDGIVGPITKKADSTFKELSKKGYTKNNIVIVSTRANRIKSDATLDEIRKVADFYEKLLKNK